jgi:glutamate-1-semialdehyde aminotransferase
VIGREEVMQAAQESFISSTYWTESVGPAAAIATIRKYQRCNVPEHLVRIGKMVQKGWRTAADNAGLDMEIGGIYPLSHFGINDPPGQEAQTLFTQMLLERGYLAGKNFYSTYAHHERDIGAYLGEVDEVFAAIAGAMRSGRLEKLLKGPVAHKGFRRLT